MIKAVKAIRGSVASGKSIVAGLVYRVPQDIESRDARILIQSKKAVQITPEPEPEKEIIEEIKKSPKKVNKSTRKRRPSIKKGE